MAVLYNKLVPGDKKFLAGNRRHSEGEENGLPLELWDFSGYGEF